MMWLCKVLLVALLASSAYSITGEDPSTVADLLKEVTLDKDNNNLVNDIAHFVVNKIQEASKVVGANGVLDPVKLQEYVTATLGMGSVWLSEKTGSLYNKIKDRVTQWWTATKPKIVPGVAGISEEEVAEEVKKEVMKTILKQVEEKLKENKIAGVTERDVEKWILPQLKKIFGDIFGFPVKLEKFDDII